MTIGDLTQRRFVIKFTMSILDTQHTTVMHDVFLELVETVKLVENISWSIVKVFFCFFA